MDSIVIGFSRPQAWFEPFSWLIRLAYWSQFSHAYVRFDLPELDKEVILQASGLKINMIEKSLFDSQEVIYKEFILPISAEDKKKLIQFGIDQLGKPYNMKGILGIMYVRVGQLLGIKLESPWDYSGSSDFCSELIAFILQTYEGIQMPMNPADMAPSDLCKLLENQKN